MTIQTGNIQVKRFILKFGFNKEIPFSFIPHNLWDEFIKMYQMPYFHSEYGQVCIEDGEMLNTFMIINYADKIKKTDRMIF